MISELNLALIEAIKCDNVCEIKHLLDNGADPCCNLGSEGRHPTPIHLAVHSKSTTTLPLMLERCDKQKLEVALAIPFSGFDSPLHFSISRLDVATTYILLRHGADPNLITPRSSGMTPLCSIPAFVENESSNESSQYKIMSLLLQFGANPDLPSKSKETPLHFLAHLASCAPDSALLLLEKASIISYEQKGCEESPPFSQTPLASALRSLCGLVSGVVISESTVTASLVKRVHSIFKFAILPLLRNGASIQPDLFSTSFDLVRISLSHSLISRIIWNDNKQFLKFLISSRKRYDIDFHSMPFRVHTQHPQYFFELLQALGTMFPPKLQELCRNVILRNLPIGPSRPNLIASLPLPQTLISYLCFEDYAPRV